MTAIPPPVLRWLEDLETKAYQRGWEDATRAMIAAASSHRIAGPLAILNDRAVEADAAGPQPIRKISPVIRAMGKTNADFVMATLREHPGLRPIGIFRVLDEAGYQPNRESILTCIKRLRNEGRIVRRGTGAEAGLYLAESETMQEAAE